MALAAKILIVATSTLVGDQRLDRIARALSEAGYEVTLWGRRFDQEAVDSYAITERPYQTWRIPCQIKKGPTAYVEFWVKLFNALSTAHAHVICAVDADTIIPVCHAAKLKGIPWVFDAHEWMSEVPEVSRRPAIKWLWKAIEHRYIPQSHGAYTVSKTLATIFENLYHTPFQLVRNSPMRRLHPIGEMRPITAPYLIYAGVINEGRGIEWLTQLDGQLPMPIVICGEGDLYEFYRKQPFRQIHFLGFIPPDTLRQYLAHAYAGLLLLDPASKSYRYSLANKFFDYTQAGIPCLYPDLPEYQELNAHYSVGIACDYHLEAVKNGIQLLMDPKVYLPCRAEAQKAALHWHWQAEIPTLLSVYQAILKVRP